MVRGRRGARLGRPPAQALGYLELIARVGFRAALVALAIAVAAAGPASGGSGAGFRLAESKVTPKRAFFDAGQPVRLRYRFAAQRPLDVVVKVVRSAGDRPVRRWLERDLASGRAHVRKWDGRRADGGVPADGRYEIRVGPVGHRGARAGHLELHDHLFPVAGPHTYGDRFGEPRSGGRVHQGQDLPSPCGTPLVAARGGRVQARGYSEALYGHWVLIDGRATDHEHFYSHLEAPTPLSEGERVHTGERIGAVGKTGNARSEFCQLHFELWPDGYRNGSPRDPLASLRSWDEFS